MFIPLESLYLELRYLSKGRSEFGENDIFKKVKYNMILGTCKISVELLNWVGKGPEVSKK